ncbi:hypothetical protein KAOT1_01140 [Kordia algicida OT-1]|uniref:Uncharacterized protein n=1 Tax=Kordia algicida OT-1 TaxID=391587 RepID=A9E8P8_9FLAO|nr:hypothetical protein KAOT1_01140 [Kordia algicida OT-1]
MAPFHVLGTEKATKMKTFAAFFSLNQFV